MTDAERIKELQRLTGKTPRCKPNKTMSMYERYGNKAGKRCKECKHCRNIGYGGKPYKCELQGLPGISKTNIRFNSIACGRFEAMKEIV